MKRLAAGGFKDITRIASSSPIMWQHICTQNSKNISYILGKYIDALQEIKCSVEQNGPLYDYFSGQKKLPRFVPEYSAGPIKESFAIYCDI